MNFLLQEESPFFKANTHTLYYSWLERGMKLADFLEIFFFVKHLEAKTVDSRELTRLKHSVDLGSSAIDVKECKSKSRVDNVYPSRIKRNKKSEDKHWRGICFFPLLWQKKKKKKCFEPRKLAGQKEQCNIHLHTLYTICNCKPDSKKSLCFKYRSKLYRVSEKYFYA